MRDTLPIGATLEAPSKRKGESKVNVNPKYARSRRREGLEKSQRMTELLVTAIHDGTMNELIERKTGRKSKRERKANAKHYRSLKVS